MGSGRWSTDVYDAAARYRAATGTSAFAYSDGGATAVHPRLDPMGVRIRESQDSAEHPTSLAIAVLFDVTGSMHRVPRLIQRRLSNLLGLVLDQGYVAHPQILFGAIGDATCDRVPLQVGQFESDNRMDDDLGRIVLEGGGGGQMTESYELAMYFMARHTSIDCHEKRGRKGHLFFIGDEMPYPRVRAREVARVIGDELIDDIPMRTILAELSGKYHVYYVLPTGTHYSGDRRVLDRWRDLLGQRVIQLDDLDALCETLALTVGLEGDAIDLDDGIRHLRDQGSSAGASVTRALATIAADHVAVATSVAPADLATTGDQIERL